VDEELVRETALNHSHIDQIHGLDEANGRQFLVLKLVDIRA